MSSTALRTSLLPFFGLLLPLLLGTGPRPDRPVDANEFVSISSVDSLLIRGKSYLNAGSNAGSRDSLRKARALFKQAVGGSTHQALAHYYAALANYRLNNLLSEEPEEKREKVLTDAVEHLEAATEIKETFADAWALLGGVYGQQLGLDPMQGIFLGPDADDALSKAQRLAPKNPRVWIILGTQDFFTPSMFGGIKNEPSSDFTRPRSWRSKKRSKIRFGPAGGMQKPTRGLELLT